MRILSFQKRWTKLDNGSFTTFRWPRKDSNKGRDWHQTEIVQIYYKSRSPDREYLGIAKIIQKKSRLLGSIDDEEAVADGFNNQGEMLHFLCGSINKALPSLIINKLTIEWVDKVFW